jgi:hypothetical protein
MKSNIYNDIDYENFESILKTAMTFWPDKIELSTQEEEDGTPLGFNVFTFEDEIGHPYFERPDCKHIIRHMLWAIFCALPKNVDGIFELKNINKERVKQKFESDVLYDIESADADQQERQYFERNMKNQNLKI